MNWSARIEDAVAGSEGARRFERKRRRVCGRVWLLLLLLVSDGGGVLRMDWCVDRDGGSHLLRS